MILTAVASLASSVDIATGALALLLKSSVLFVLAAMGAHMLRTASQRRLAWALVFGVVLALPLGEFWSPRWQLPLVDLQHDYLTWTITIGPLALPVAAWALLIWLFGAGWALVRLTNDGRAARGLLARATAVAPNELAASLGAQVFSDRIVAAGGQIRMAWTEELETAAVIGWRHPTILLPDTARLWTPEMLRAALLHEREHIREHDWLIMSVERLVVALYWPNPLVWAARRRAAVTREIAADDAVIRADIAPSSYARQLLDLSRSRDSRHGTAPLRAAVGLGGASVAPRVRALFSSTHSHDSATRTMRHAIVAATLTVALPAIALQPMLCR